MAKDNICLKQWCIAFNILFGLLGTTELMNGIVITVNNKQFDMDAQTVGILFCVSGSFFILLAFLGFYGSYKEKKRALKAYIGFFALLIIGCAKVIYYRVSSKSQSKPNGPIIFKSLETTDNYLLGLDITFLIVVVISLLLSLMLHCHI